MQFLVLYVTVCYLSQLIIIFCILLHEPLETLVPIGLLSAATLPRST
jgi:hypothetical protein